MNDKMDPSHLICELRWLANYDNVINDWISVGRETGSYAAEEFYNNIFDDYLICEAINLYNIDQNVKYYIHNVANFLIRAFPDHEKIDLYRLLTNKYFLISRKI